MSFLFIQSQNGAKTSFRIWFMPGDEFVSTAAAFAYPPDLCFPTLSVVAAWPDVAIILRKMSFTSLKTVGLTGSPCSVPRLKGTLAVIQQSVFALNHKSMYISLKFHVREAEPLHHFQPDLDIDGVD